ncbi:MAG: M48 family metallopeptidase [Cyanobacteria bacterium P01_H01_bin.119]
MGNKTVQKFWWLVVSSAIVTLLLSLFIVFTQQTPGVAQSASPAEVLTPEPIETGDELPLPPEQTDSDEYFGSSETESDAAAASDSLEQPEAPPPTATTSPQPDKVIDPYAIDGPDLSDPLVLTPAQEILREADRLYLAGDTAAATALYRQIKEPDWDGQIGEPLPAVYSDPEQLPPGGAFYWQEAIAGIEQNNKNRTLVSLQLLTEEYPEFLPGHRRYAQALIQYEQPEAATAAVEAVTALYPTHPDVLRAQAEVYGARQQWLESAIAARQFSVLHPDHPDQADMLALADDSMGRFRGELRERLQGNLVTNVITGALGYALTGGLLAPFTAIDSTLLMLQGEQAVGDRVAAQVQQVLPMIDDPDVTDYVRGIGEKLAQLTGRDEFDYQFYVIADETLNAFALPGGKIFINAGAILKTNSEAELSGLIAHEVSHAVLSHGFQLATSGNLTASLAQYIPIPQLANLAAGAAITGYSRQMERQADIMGTQILAGGGYAADGLHNLMITLNEESQNPTGPAWLSTHPAPPERVSYLARLVEDGGYNRYQFEGIEQHHAIKMRLAPLLAAFERKQDSLQPER